MTAPTFTPGPWRAVQGDPQGSPRSWTIRGPEPASVAIAELFGGFNPEYGDPAANAALIQTAPKLLKALQVILTHADDPDDDGEHWDEDRARAVEAITEARTIPAPAAGQVTP